MKESKRIPPPKWFRRKCSHSASELNGFTFRAVAANGLKSDLKQERKRKLPLKSASRYARVLSSGHLHRFMAHKSHTVWSARRACMSRLANGPREKKKEKQNLSIRSAAREIEVAREATAALQFHFRTRRWRFRFSIFATFSFHLAAPSHLYLNHYHHVFFCYFFHLNGLAEHSPAYRHLTCRVRRRLKSKNCVQHFAQ